MEIGRTVDVQNTYSVIGIHDRFLDGTAIGAAFQVNASAHVNENVAI